MAAVQRTFMATYNKKKVKVIVGTVGVQVFDLHRKLLTTLRITEMPEWTVGRTVHEAEYGPRNRVRVEHWVRVYTGKISVSTLPQSAVSCESMHGSIVDGSL